MVHHALVSVSIGTSVGINQVNAEVCRITFQIEGMFDVMHAIDLTTLLISAYQEEIKGITYLDKEMLSCIIATNPVTLQDFVEARMSKGRV